MQIHNKRKIVSFLHYKKEFEQYGLKKVRSYELVLHWLNARLSRNQFLILSGILVGFTAGLAGVLLKSLVHKIHFWIVTKVHFEDQIFFYVVFPFLGILLTTIIVITIFKGNDRKGIGAILYEIAQNSSVVSSVKMYSQIIQSAVTVGLGGSAGLESPMAVTGAAIGSNFAQTYRLGYKERTLLLAAGASAGIAAAFNAPIAGIMFAFEILLTGVVFSDFIPLVVAAVCGSLISTVLLQEDVLFRFHARQAFNYHNLPYYLILGITSGLYARYYVLIYHKIDHFIKNLKYSKLKIAFVSGLGLSLLCVILPPLFGEGYDTLKTLTNENTYKIINNSFFGYLDLGNWTVIIFLALICILKVFATSLTIFGGGNGGNFAPSLFAGGTWGFLFATLCQQLGLTDVPVGNLVLVGMAGVMSGVLYAPLTAIFLIAESSQGYDLFIPLMIVAVISYLMARWFSPVNPDYQSMVDQGKIFTQEHDKNIINSLHLRDFIDYNSQTIMADEPLSHLFELIKKGDKNIFAIVSAEGVLEGVLTMDDIRPYLFRNEAEEPPTIHQIMKAPPAVVHLSDQAVAIIKIFDDTNAWNLPVINENDKFIGFISKSKILSNYRDLLKDYSR